MTKIISSDIDQIKRDLLNLETDTIVIITEQNVWSLYKSYFEDFARIVWVSPDGEAGKTFDNYKLCVDHLLETGIHRNIHIVSLGGGTVSDFAGFVASTILRGVTWSSIPTTLLAMVDAAIGGKVALNSSWGKNQIGQFHLPNNVWICDTFLKTLPDNEWMNGKGEILKYGFLSEKIFSKIVENNHFVCDSEFIFQCAQYKNDITSSDLKESGRRKILNLGHTFGHAFEKANAIPHGIAVVLGIKYIIDNFVEGKAKSNLQSAFNKLIDGLQVEVGTEVSYDRSVIASYVQRDKKKISQDEIELVLLHDVGAPYIKKISMDEVL